MRGQVEHDYQSRKRIARRIGLGSIIAGLSGIVISSIGFLEYPETTEEIELYRKANEVLGEFEHMRNVPYGNVRIYSLPEGSTLNKYINGPVREKVARRKELDEIIESIRTEIKDMEARREIAAWKEQRHEAGNYFYGAGAFFALGLGGLITNYILAINAEQKRPEPIVE